MSDGAARLPAGLSLASLMFIARLVRETRRRIVDEVYRRELDGPGWGVNCLVFDRIRNTIRLAEGQDEFGLRVLEPGLHFVFEMHGVPMRFYRGRRDRSAPPGQVQLNEPEVHAVQLCLDILLPSAEPRMFRILYETDPRSLLVTGVFLAALNPECRVVDAWRIPGGEDDGLLSIGTADEPVDLPPAPVELIEEIIDGEEVELAGGQGA